MNCETLLLCSADFDKEARSHNSSHDKRFPQKILRYEVNLISPLNLFPERVNIPLHIKIQYKNLI